MTGSNIEHRTVNYLYFILPFIMKYKFESIGIFERDILLQKLNFAEECTSEGLCIAGFTRNSIKLKILGIPHVNNLYHK